MPLALGPKQMTRSETEQKLDVNWPKLPHTGENWPKLPQPGPNWRKSGVNWPKLGVNMPKLA